MRVGFIGLGTMGRGMAANLLKAGHSLVVHDLSRAAASQHLESGAVWVDTPRALAQACDLVFTSLPAPPDVERVYRGESGLGAGFKPGSAWFDLSTNGVDEVRRLHVELAAQSVSFLDAPVSGGRAGAASAKMAIWVGGERAVFDRHEKVLRAMGDQIRYVGEIGAGTIAKLVHNSASSAISAILGEVFIMGVKAGLDPLPLFAAIREGGIGRQRTFDKLGTRFLPGEFDKPSFALRLAYKDLQLGLQLARSHDVPMRLCSLVGQEMLEAMNRGWGERDVMSFLLLQQERSGLERIAVPLEKVQSVMEKQ